MFIRVVNSHGDRRGDPLLININSIVSVYEDHSEGGSLKTVIYASDKLAWTVEESIEKIHALIKEAINTK